MEEFQQIFDYFNMFLKSKDENNNKNTNDANFSLRQTIFEIIGVYSFCLIMDMEYSNVNVYRYKTHYEEQQARFHNKLWILNVPLWGEDWENIPHGFENIILKDVGTYWSYSPDENAEILREWLDYCKERCRINGINIDD
ncbi:MAG: hypothetical protein JW891_02355 [Candidatus Lokiarchaeota archaeon]|nr:hypothetical protein [Candidatus Lokiarchaeota archaeon]